MTSDKEKIKIRKPIAPPTIVHPDKKKYNRKKKHKKRENETHTK